ncbi:retrovirus-related pol polyprotein from transposon TNT 1-94 [Tanacetum coccineum]
MASQVVSDFSTYMTKETPFDFEFENGVQDGKGDLDQRLVAAVCQEMMKIFKGKEVDHNNNVSTSKPHAGTFFYGCKPYKVYSFHVSLNILSKHLQLDIRIDWIVDTGASDHMLPYLHLFQSIRILKKPIRIKLPDGTRKWIDKVGSIQINSSLILHNVFYVPDFKDPSTKKVLAVREGFNNLYICKPSSGSSTKHPSIRMPTFLVMSSFVNKDVKTEDVTLDRFHAILGHTSVLSILSDFMAYIANHFKAKPKFLRSDNGTEIVNNDCLAYLRKQGIVHQRSMVYTPQQNAIVERKHRHLLDTARALKFHSGLPNKFWGDCVLTATYLINKMPMKILDWKTPFEMLHGMPPSYDHLRVIGCLCFATVTKPHKDKFAPRSIKSVLIGYPPGQKGYKLYDLQTHEVFCSRDVSFQENVFPFKKDFISSEVPSNTQQWPMEDVVSNEEFVPCSVPHTSSDPVMPNTPSDYNVPSPTSDLPSSSAEPDMPIPEPMISTRRSARTTVQPSWLKDFVTSKHKASSVVSAATNKPAYPLFQQADFQSYPDEYVASLANVMATSEPNSYSQAVNDPKWVEAMEKELKALETNDTWVLTELPDGCKAISSKWVYKIKYYADGTVERYKARLVIRGFDQKEGVDYKHTFSPVAKAATVRVLIAIATAKGWPLHQLDINNAFLHGFVDEEIYMKPPEGYTKASQGQVCKLNKSLYGLKQASRQWNQELSKFLVTLGFKQSKHDYSLFVKAQGVLFTVVQIYVDDILLTGNSVQDIQNTKLALDSKFTIKDLGLARYFLGIELCNTENGTFLHQRKYVLDLLKDAGLTATKPTPFPLPQNMKLSLDKGKLKSLPEYPEIHYRRRVGRLLSTY